MPLARADLDKWAAWARQEAVRIDPVRNGTIARAIEWFLERVVSEAQSQLLLARPIC
jgi:hypothetical protein